MRTKKNEYLTPSITAIESAVERGFCVTIQFTPDTEGLPTSSGLGLDDMTESYDENGW